MTDDCDVRCAIVIVMRPADIHKFTKASVDLSTAFVTRANYDVTN
jgi:hypothetical protein